MKSLKALISKNTIHRAHSGGMFSKSNITCGTVVMFDDNTYGVYLEGKIGQQMKDEMTLDNAKDKWFLTHSRSGKSICFFNLSSLDDNLRYEANNELDVIRVYDRRLKEDEIKRFTKKEFYHQISAIVNKMPYKERK